MTILEINPPEQAWLNRDPCGLSHVNQLNFARSLVRDAVAITIHIKARESKYLAYTVILSRIPVGKMEKIDLEMIVPEKLNRRLRSLQQSEINSNYYQV